MGQHDGEREDGRGGSSGKGASEGGMAMHGADLKRRFFASLVLTVPILLLSSPMGLTLPITLTFPGSDWVVAVLATVLFAYGGWPFLRGAADELKRRQPAMMTLVALGITTAYAYSIYAFVQRSVLHADGMHMDFFWELATLIVIMLLGHWVEMRAVMGAGDALKEMAELLPAQAHVEQPGGSFADVPLDEVQVGQTVMVEAGEKVPADGEVVRGESQVNEALVTGEARDVAKGAGDSVFGGSQNGDRHGGVGLPGPGHEAGVAGAAGEVARRGAVGQGGALAVLRGRGRGHRGLRRVACRHGQRGRRAHAHGHGVRHRVPARARPGHTARGGALHVHRRAERPARAPPAGARGGAAR